MGSKRSRKANIEDDQTPETAPAAAPAVPPPTTGPRVSLSVFLTVSTAKPDQTAGFSHWAKKNRLGPMTIREWKQEYQNFMGRPIN